MSAVVVDTHALIWYLLASQKISSRAIASLDDAVRIGDSIYLSSISVVEIIYLVEKGKLPEIAFDRLISSLYNMDSSFVVIPLDLNIAQSIQKIPREMIPDMPDRIITATALHMNLPLVTRDKKIQAAGIKTIW